MTSFRVFRYAGPLAIVSAWITIFWARSAYPGYQFIGHSLSDLGGPMSPHPAIYNEGLMITGGFIVLFGIDLLRYAKTSIGSAGGTLFALDGIFLGLIGYFHEGTSPHVFISSWFFIEASLASVVWGIGHLRQGLWPYAYLLLGIGAFFVGFFTPFPSTAYREMFGVVAIDLFGLLSFVQTRPSPSRYPPRPFKNTKLRLR